MHINPLVQAVQPARARLREWLGPMQGWMLGSGRRIDLDLCVLILDAKAEGLHDLGAPDFWTRSLVYHVLAADVFNWCSSRHVLVPPDVPGVLDGYLRFLTDEGLLAEGSHPLSVLLEPIRCYGGVGPPMDRCTCFLPDEALYSAP